MKQFPISEDVAVITSTYVTDDKMPILYVSREYDEEDGESWQFHCGNNDYSMEKMLLVRLGTILSLDRTVGEVRDLAIGYCAKRAGLGQPWSYELDDE